MPGPRSGSRKSVRVWGIKVSELPGLAPIPGALASSPQAPTPHPECACQRYCHIPTSRVTPSCALSCGGSLGPCGLRQGGLAGPPGCAGSCTWERVCPGRRGGAAESLGVALSRRQLLRRGHRGWRKVTKVLYFSTCEVRGSGGGLGRSPSPGGRCTPGCPARSAHGRRTG